MDPEDGPTGPTESGLPSVARPLTLEGLVGPGTGLDTWPTEPSEAGPSTHLHCTPTPPPLTHSPLPFLPSQAHAPCALAVLTSVALWPRISQPQFGIASARRPFLAGWIPPDLLASSRDTVSAVCGPFSPADFQLQEGRAWPARACVRGCSAGLCGVARGGALGSSPDGLCRRTFLEPQGTITGTAGSGPSPQGQPLSGRAPGAGAQGHGQPAAPRACHGLPWPWTSCQHPSSPPALLPCPSPLPRPQRERGVLPGDGGRWSSGGIPGPCRGDVGFGGRPSPMGICSPRASERTVRPPSSGASLTLGGGSRQLITKQLMML